MYIKTYPWTLDSYGYNANDIYTKYSLLSSIDGILNQRQYVKITLLNWDEEPIQEIQGEIVSGEITKDGSSSARRVGNLSLNVNGGEYDLESLEINYAINKKVFIELGIKNETGIEEWSDYDILWFPQGVFIFSSFSINTSSTSAVSISLDLKDKICMLDGTVGGKFQSSIILDTTYDMTEDGVQYTRYLLIYEIIQELVNHFGNEDLNNIVIEDIDLAVKAIVKWNGSTNGWYGQIESEDGSKSYYLENSKSELLTAMGITESDIYDGSPYSIAEIENGSIVGYVYKNFTYNNGEDFELNAGDNVCTALDKIKSYLGGNYEYFYDEYGVFHFREIKNYLNTSQVKSILDDYKQTNYNIEYIPPKSVYTFDDEDNMITLTNSPLYENIKNDFVVHGTKKSSDSNVSTDIFYHLVIDTKPDIDTSGYSNILIYNDPAISTFERIIPCKPVILKIDETKEDKLLDASNSIMYLNESPIENDKFLLTGVNTDFIYGLRKDTSTIYTVESTDFSDYLEKLKTDAILNNLELSYSISEETDYQYLIDNYMIKIQNEFNISSFNFGESYTSSFNGNMVEGSKYNVYVKNMYQYGQDIVEDLAIKEKILYCGYSIDDNTIKDDYTDLYKVRYIIKCLNNQLSFYNILQNDGVQGLDIKINIINNQLTFWEYYEKYYEMIAFYKADGDIDLLKELNIDYSQTTDEVEYVSYPTTTQTIGGFNNYVFYKYVELKSEWKQVDWIYYYDIDNNVYVNSTPDYRYLESLFEDINSAVITDELTSETFWYNEDDKKQLISDYKLNIDGRGYVADDWRTEIILQGLESLGMATDKGDCGYYYEELIANWPGTYNMATQEFYSRRVCYYYSSSEKDDSDKEEKTYTVGTYYLDMIDSANAIYGQYCVDNIGRRTNTTIDEDINCLFSPEIPQIGIIYDSNDLPSFSLQQEYANNADLNQCIVSDNVFKNICLITDYNDAYTQIKYDLVSMSIYQSTISLTTRPIYYLEPNCRITIRDASTNTFGEYNIKSITCPLGGDSTMTISCTQAISKI